jgi:hypothetical protein
MSLSYQEKSIWGSLVTILVVYGYYFAGIRHKEAEGLNIGRMVAAVTAVALIEVVYHILIAATSGVEPRDERDIAIDGKAFRTAYFVLAAGACATAFTSSPFFTGNAALLSLIVAEVAKFATQLLLYRRGV